MVIDTSAMVAIIQNEFEGPAFARAIVRSSRRRISAATLVELYIVVDRVGDPVIKRKLDDFIQVAGLTIEPVTAEQAQIAREAHRDYGRGTGHPASLNFGDCFSYALAKDVSEPLLFKGNDFVHTDVRTVPIEV